MRIAANWAIRSHRGSVPKVSKSYQRNVCATEAEYKIPLGLNSGLVRGSEYGASIPGVVGMVHCGADSVTCAPCPLAPCPLPLAPCPLGLFTLEDIQELVSQHGRETGQQFEQERLNWETRDAPGGASNTDPLDYRVPGPHTR